MSKKKSWGFDMKNLDRSARPQDDFFQFANGGWLKKNPIPHDESRWNTFSVLRKKNTLAIRSILESAKKQKPRTGSNLQKIRDYYISGMNVARRNQEGIKSLRPYLETVETIKTKGGVVRLAGMLQLNGIGSLWRSGTDQDMKNKNVVRLYLEQGGLGLPDRDYYLKTDKRSGEIRKKYLAYIEKLHKLVFKKYEKGFANKVMKIETGLAKASMTRVELRDLEKQYNKTTFNGLLKKYPAIDWNAYFSEIHAKKNGTIIVSQPLFLKKTDKMLRDISLDDWKCYFRWKITNAYPQYLGESTDKAHFDCYGKALAGIKKMKPQWERTAIEVDSMIGEALGAEYVKKYFPETAKKEINILVNNLVAVYRERIKALDWMSAETKKKAVAKLNAIKRKLGYPDKWKNYRKLKISSDSYILNQINSYKFEFARDIKKIGKKPDKKEWGMTPPTVNAYNNYLFNEIVFPAGIMQPPFFHPDADDAVNYGGIGAVIGHELTHGFDDKGSTFDKNGEMKNWWHKADRKLFMKKAQGLVEQYDKFEALHGIYVNGKLTLGENIADLGGLVLAYYAYRKATHGEKKTIIDGFTPEQRFFLGAAQAECGIAREASLKLQIATDPHSPSKARVNLAFCNMAKFYEAFGVKKGDKMWRPEKDRVVIW